MIKPRNSLAVLKLIEQKDQQIGAITVPSANDLYCEAEVVAVGPGTVSAEGGRSETFDLKPGQRVWVKQKEKRGELQTVLAGIRYIDGGTVYHVFEQSSIVGVIAEPVERKDAPPSSVRGDVIRKSGGGVLPPY